MKLFVSNRGEDSLFAEMRDDKASRIAYFFSMKIEGSEIKAVTESKLS
jgi:hypothetical protein